MAGLERNPFTYPEVKTLLDGVTVGGHKLSDEQQVLSIRNGWNYVIEAVLNNKVSFDMDTFKDLSEHNRQGGSFGERSFQDRRSQDRRTHFVLLESSELESSETELPIIGRYTQ